MHASMSANRTPPEGHSRPIRIVNRRDVVLGGCAAVALVRLFGSHVVLAAAPEDSAGAAGSEAAIATAGSPLPLSEGFTPTRQFEEALQAVLQNGEPVVGEPLKLELPELAENGNVVPYSISVENPMTDTDYVRTLHLLSTANPQAVVARFHLVPATGKAAVSGRMRLAKSQDVVAVAELSSGQFLAAVSKVEVTIGGCGNE